MGYATVLTVVMNSQDIEIMKETSAAFAAERGAHLEVLCIAVDGTQAGYYFAGATSLMIDDGRAQAVAQASALKKEAEAALRMVDVLYEVHPVVVQLGTLTQAVADRAQYADLVIQPPPYAPGRSSQAPAIVEAALFAGRAAVLVTDRPVGKPTRVVLAWNESPEAMAAARKSLPLIALSKRADILIVDPPRHDITYGDPGSGFSRMLARHGVNPSVVIEAQTVPSVSDALLRHVRDAEAGLVVMGAYGHSRMREAILGGATRRMLEQNDVPVFLAR